MRLFKLLVVLSIFLLLILLGACQSSIGAPTALHTAETTPFTPVTESTPPPPTQSPTGAPTATRDPANPFIRIARSSDFGGKITDLWIDPDTKQLYLSSLKGLYHIAEQSWAPLYSQSVLKILGKDNAGRIWSLTSGGISITSWDGSSSATYGEPMGWTAPHSANYLGFGFGDQIVTDHSGRVYIAPGFDTLRRFEPEISAWRELSAQELTFRPLDHPEKQEYLLTDVVKSSSGHIWVSSCVGDGDTLKGNGLRRLEGNVWKEILALQDQCILDLETDSAGRVWAAGVDTLFAYNPNTDSWTKNKIPEDFHGRQTILKIHLDNLGRPWLTVMRGGSARQYGSLAIYFFPFSEWVKVYETETWMPASLYTTPGNEIVFCINGGVYQTQKAEPQLIGRLSPGNCLVQPGEGKQVWIAMLDGKDAGLWLYDTGK